MPQGRHWVQMSHQSGRQWLMSQFFQLKIINITDYRNGIQRNWAYALVCSPYELEGGEKEGSAGISKIIKTSCVDTVISPINFLTNRSQLIRWTLKFLGKKLHNPYPRKHKWEHWFFNKKIENDSFYPADIGVLKKRQIKVVFLPKYLGTKRFFLNFDYLRKSRARRKGLK